MENTTALEYTRYNSGTHFMDSGGDNGRQWQRKPNEDPMVSLDSDGSGVINLTKWLEEKAELDDEHENLHEKLKSDDHKDKCWFEGTDDAMIELGYRQIARDNIYNCENDFDQVFVYEAWIHEDHDEGSDDWLYDQNIKIILYVHTGADVRGGYSPPLMVTFDDDGYNLPMEWSVAFDCEKLDESEQQYFECGYTSYPFGQFDKLGFELIKVSEDTQSATYKRDGEEFVFYPTLF